MLILKKKDIIQHVDLNEGLIPIIEEAFISLSKGKTVMPPIMRIDIEKYHGESDVKAAYVEGLDSFAIKIASGFFDNPKLGLPSSNGLMVLLDSKTGVVKSVLLDEGYLTDTRTAIAGAIATKYLSNQNANSVGIIGAGIQAKLQLQAIMLVRKINKIGIKLIDTKNKSLSSFKLIFILNFLTKTKIISRNGNNIPICLAKNIVGCFIWFKILASSDPVLRSP